MQHLRRIGDPASRSSAVSHGQRSCDCASASSLGGS